MTMPTGARHTGIANLPLHGGKAPPWLFERMVKLAGKSPLSSFPISAPTKCCKGFPIPIGSRLSAVCWVLTGTVQGLPPRCCGALKEGVKGIEKDLGVIRGRRKGPDIPKNPG